MAYNEHFAKTASQKNFIDITTEINETVDNLEPIKYYNKIIQKQDFGFEISSFEKEFPQLIANIDGNTKAIDYTSIIPILVKEVQELKKQLKPKRPHSVSMDETETPMETMRSHAPIFKSPR